MLWAFIVKRQTYGQENKEALVLTILFIDPFLNGDGYAQCTCYSHTADSHQPWSLQISQGSDVLCQPV